MGGYYGYICGHRNYACFAIELSPATRASISSRVLVSVTQTRKSLALPGTKRDKASPPSIPFSSASRDRRWAAAEGPRTTNSLKRGPEKGSEKPASLPISLAAYAVFCTHWCATS